MLLLTPSVKQKIEKLRRRFDARQLSIDEYAPLLLRLDPMSYDAHFALGVAAIDRSNWIEARPHFRKAIEAAPYKTPAYLGLAGTYQKAGDDPEMLAALGKLAARRQAFEGDLSEFRQLLLDAVPEGGIKPIEALDIETVKSMVVEISLRSEGEPARVIEALRPLRLIQVIVDYPMEGLEPDEVDRIVEHGEACTPLLMGILRNYLDDPDGTVPVAMACLALLGAGGPSSVMGEVLEFVWLDRPDVSEAAAWAAHCLAERFPELRPKLRGVEPISESLYDLCAFPLDAGFDQESPEEGSDDARISKLLLDLIKKHVKRKEMDFALDKFFGPGQSHELEDTNVPSFFDWVLNDYTPRAFNRTVPLEYLARHHSQLSLRDRQVLEAWANSRYSLYEIQDVEPGKGVTVQDLLVGDSFFVHDVSSSRQLVKWDSVLSRTRNEFGHRVFTATGWIVPQSIRGDLLDWVREDQRRSGLGWPPYLKANSDRLRRKCAALQEELAKNFKMVTAEGDEVMFSKAIFEILDKPSLLAALGNSNELRFNGDDTDLAWVEPKTERSLGSLHVTETLVLECMSRQRLARGVAMVHELAGDFVKEKAQEFEDTRHAMKRLKDSPASAVESTPIPPEVKAELMSQYLEQHYSTWPDQPLPALHGLTPREASKDPAERGRLIDILKSFENSGERNRRLGEPTYDFNKLKRELGIEF